jgi:epoxyqueuosine reductase
LKADSEPKQLADEVKEVALEAGADLVGIVSTRAIDAFPPIWVGWTYQEYTKKTTDIMADAKSVVVIGYHVWDNMLEIAIRKGDRWVYPGYFPLRIPSLTVIHHLEKKGYKAIPSHSVSYKRLAQLAGFGNFGKNALIVNPTYGPWIRLAAVLTNAEMTPDKPFDQDLCGDCENCIKACPAGALTPYKVDDTKCLVGIHLTSKNFSKYAEMLKLYEPSLTKNSHLMCIECQKVCKYGKERS